MEKFSDNFEEIADFGDQKYFVRDFGIVALDDKEVPVLLVAEIMNYYDATGEDEFEEKPYAIMVSIFPYMDFIDKKHISGISESSSIGEDEVNYSDLMSNMGGIPVVAKYLDKQYKNLNDAEEYLIGKEVKKQLNAMEIMIGFYLDGAINRKGDSRWSYLEYLVDSTKDFYGQ